MKTPLKTDDFFTLIDGSNIAQLTDYGKRGTSELLIHYTGSQIKEYSGVSRSALKNYVHGSNRISKRGQEALKKLIHRFNNDSQIDEGASPLSNPKDLSLYSEKELLEELKRRGFTVLVSV